MGSRRRLYAHGIAARAQAENPANPSAWIAQQERDAEEEIGRLREYLRRCRKARKALDQVEQKGGVPS